MNCPSGCYAGNFCIAFWTVSEKWKIFYENGDWKFAVYSVWRTVYHTEDFTIGKDRRDNEGFYDKSTGNVCELAAGV